MTKDSAFAKAMTDKATTKTLRPEARGQLLEANGSAYAKASADKAKDQRPKTKDQKTYFPSNLIKANTE